MHKIIATGFGIGYIGKGSGTIAALACCGVWYVTGGGNPLVATLITVAITGIGIWSATNVEKYWGVHSSRVVIDEIAGMCISLLFLPFTFPVLCAAFVLFRFFDIVKPLYIRRTEALPGGWGVMTDDVLAGLYTNIILQLMVRVVLI